MTMLPLRWVVSVVDMLSGQRVRDLDVAEHGTWGIRLDDVDELAVETVWGEASGLRKWRHGLLVSVDYGDGPKPLCGGPVRTPAPKALEPADVSGCTLRADGVRAFLQYRYATAGDHQPGDHASMQTASVTHSGLSLGQIGWELVASSLAKTGGWLPITNPRPAVAGPHERTVEGYNVANNNLDKILDDLSNLLDGPDFMFRPRWADDTETHAEWVMVHGRPIPQAREWSLDLTAAAGPVSTAVLTVSDGDDATRVYGTGAGEGEGTLIRIAAHQPADMPLLEAAVHVSDTDNPDVVEANAAALLGTDPLVQLSIGWDARTEGLRLDQVFVGDLARIVTTPITDLVPADGLWRLIALKGQIGSPLVVGEFQPQEGVAA